MGKIKVKKEKNFELKKQDILTGSRVLNSNTTKNRIEYFIDNVESNLSFILEKKNLNKKKELCEKFIKYRNLWKEQPLNIINDNNINFKAFLIEFEVKLIDNEESLKQYEDLLKEFKSKGYSIYLNRPRDKCLSEAIILNEKAI